MFQTCFLYKKNDCFETEPKKLFVVKKVIVFGRIFLSMTSNNNTNRTLHVCSRRLL